MLSVFLASLVVSPDVGPQVAVDLSWMDGHWLSCEQGSQVSETWAGADHVRLGSSLTLEGSTLAAFEQVRVHTTDGVTRYVAMPNGGEAVAFDLVDQTPTGAVFQNAAHDWPNVVVYEREGDVMTATVRGLDGEDEPEMRWRFEAAPLGARCPPASNQ